MCLSALNCQAFIHRSPERHLINQSDVDARHRNRAPFSAAEDCLANDVCAISTELHGSLQIVKNRVNASDPMCFDADRVDTAVRPPPFSQCIKPFVNVLLIEVNGLGFAVS